MYLKTTGAAQEILSCNSARRNVSSSTNWQKTDWNLAHVFESAHTTQDGKIAFTQIRPTVCDAADAIKHTKSVQDTFTEDHKPRHTTPISYFVNRTQHLELK